MPDGYKANQRRARRRTVAAFAGLFAAAVVLILALAYQVWRTIPELTALALDRERASFLVGDVMRRMNGVTLRLMRGLLKPLTDDDVAAIETAVTELDNSMADLAVLIDKENPDVADDLQALVAGFEVRSVRAIEAARRGDRERFAELIEAELFAHLPLRKALFDELIASNQEESVQTLREMSGELRRLLAALLASGAAYLALLAAVAAYTLVRQRHQMAEGGRYLARIEQANQDLEAFAGRIAHDLRAPLAPIALAADQLARHSPDPASRRLAKRILRSTRGASQMIDSLLAFSRAGEVDGDAVADASEAVASVLDTTSDQVTKQRATVHSDVPRTLVAMDVSLLRQVITNLLSNALRHAGWSEPPEIWISLEPRGDVALFRVADNGPGVPPSKREEIFHPFRRLDTGMGGVGLGLATVRRIVEAHGGAAGVTARRGGGATFWFTVPLAEAQPESSHPPLSAAHAPPPP